MVRRRTLLWLVSTALAVPVAGCATKEPPREDGERLRAQTVRALLRDAERERQAGNLALAKVLLLEADREDPNNEEVYRRLARVRAQLGDEPGTADGSGAMPGMRELQHQRASAIVEQLVQRGRQLMTKGDFGSAIQQFRAALLRVETLESMDWGDTPESIRELLNRAAAAQDRPNVVILLTDDQGTLDANCYGSSDLETPNIDRLSATGVRFTQAYAHTVCCPARAALLTGRHPQRSGVSSWTQGDMNGRKGINMALREVTLAEALKEAGYRTALFGKWHLGAHRDFGPRKQGFDEFFGIRDGFIDNYNHHFLHGRGFHDLYEGTKRVDARGKYFPELMVQRSLEFLEQNKDRPFFLYVPFNIPHYPEQALKEFTAKAKGIEDAARRSYAAIVATTDHYVGRILDKLEALKLRDNTIVIFMSDNGHSEETGNRIRVDEHTSGLPKGHFYGASGGGNTGKWIGRKGTFLEGGIRVPAIISYPSKLPSGEVRNQIITAMDWYPTVLALCGVERKGDAPKLDGHDLMPVIRSAEAASGYGGVLHFAWQNRWMVRKGEWKLLGRGRKNLSLRRLAGDAPEAVNFVKKKPEIVKRLRAMHEAWARDVRPE